MKPISLNAKSDSGAWEINCLQGKRYGAFLFNILASVCFGSMQKINCMSKKVLM